MIMVMLGPEDTNDDVARVEDQPKPYFSDNPQSDDPSNTDIDGMH